jgi:hypothetical protein
MKDQLRTIVKKVPLLGKVYRQRDELRGITNRLWVLPGHFYSPIPDLEELRRGKEEVFAVTTNDLPGIDLNEQKQLVWLDILKGYYGDLPFSRERLEGLRYWFDNPAFSYFDAIVLYGVVRHIKPGRIIEVGSGYSSCLFLDTNELYFENKIACTFIEPYPQLLESLIKEEDQKTIEIIPRKLQEVDLEIFRRLEPGDILFVDSSHVAKTNSDVNRIFFEILPLLNQGVYVHFHDICYPFEYPSEWVFQGRAWNEAYVLRAFLEFNSAFKIEIFNSFLQHFYRPKLEQEMPLCVQYADGNITAGGSSIWLRKV